MARRNFCRITMRQSPVVCRRPTTDLNRRPESATRFTVLGAGLLIGTALIVIIPEGIESLFSEVDTIRQGVGQLQTIGLVVHAAADGLALGAAAGLSKTDVEVVIFLAIMFYTGTCSVWFVSFLMHEDMTNRQSRYHLLLFSLAAPLAAFFSYFGLVRVSIMYITQVPITGITMLFSAGTFLYVSTVHVLNEVTHMSSSSGGNGSTSKLTNHRKLLLL
ncbi:LOW QUALITY PROTEIN: zinc transporter ZIP9-like [Gigantopelta aegis]|uniref:LOW QUALITY PROTEIN: zinc transporter ZIP9-like n=1 Tax=Gigantopelta aegis TaxID=1735272 RepID=UPI001B88DDBF|nr:LOW QUALITY PROTEIN: zinc transporter ZIP9-like [Gigantopelta aegis]